MALAFYGESFPMSVSVFSEPGLLTRHREEMERRGAGPQKANEALVAYLEAERDLGRVRDDADPEAAAAMLLGACFQRAFLASFSGEDVIPTREEGSWQASRAPWREACRPTGDTSANRGRPQPLPPCVAKVELAAGVRERTAVAVCWACTGLRHAGGECAMTA